MNLPPLEFPRTFVEPLKAKTDITGDGTYLLLLLVTDQSEDRFGVYRGGPTGWFGGWRFSTLDEALAKFEEETK